MHGCRQEEARKKVAEQMVLSGRLGDNDTVGNFPRSISLNFAHVCSIWLTFAGGLQLEPVVIGVGHSLGGAGCVMAELQAP